ncbi:MAG: hypothetical protein JSS07_01925 [Proteobacteria bacterium]|nr:hypothetical protein [Pseudomonadota bacterium]
MTIQFRANENEHTLANDANVSIVAPFYVPRLLKKLSPHFINKTFKIGNSQRTWQIKAQMTLLDLVALARNSVNDFSNLEALAALNELAALCAIAGKDTATHYRKGSLATRTALNQEVYILDMPTYEFFQHAMIRENTSQFLWTLLDNEIYENVVGEKKPTFAQAKKEKTNRFIEFDKTILFDTKAYHAFIAQSFMLAIRALHTATEENPQALNLKFLNNNIPVAFSDEMNDAILLHYGMGILKGLKQFDENPHNLSCIKRLELAPCKETNTELKRVYELIQFLCKKNNIEFACTQEDVLAPTAPQFKTAAFYREGIEENLQGRGHKFNPICNIQIQEHLEQYVQLKESKSHKPRLTLAQLAFNNRWPLATTAIKLLLLLPLKLSWPLFAGIALGTFVGTKIIEKIRDSFKRQQYDIYCHKAEADLNKLNKTQVTSFEIGYNAAMSGKQQLWGLCQWQAYKAPKAYYAGYETKLQNNQTLKNNIKAKTI